MVEFTLNCFVLQLHLTSALQILYFCALQWFLERSAVLHWLCCKVLNNIILERNNGALSSGEPKPLISNIGNYWLRVTTWYIHCKITNFVARQATLSNIACQATLAFVTETKLLVYNCTMLYQLWQTTLRVGRSPHYSVQVWFWFVCLYNTLSKKWHI